jgi:hypothetical protein
LAVLSRQDAISLSLQVISRNPLAASAQVLVGSSLSSFFSIPKNKAAGS